MSCCCLTRNTVADRVFHQRLQNKIGDQEVEDLGLNLHLDDQAILEARAFEIQIAPEELQLLRELDSFSVRSFQSQPEKVAESGDHYVGDFKILVQECRDGD